MVSSAWFAWLKCPPLHPCCHRGNQPGQTTHRVIVLYLFSRFSQPVVQSLPPSTALYLKGALPLLFLLSGFRSVTERRLSFLSWFSWISDLFLQTHSHKLLQPSCATPSVLCLTLLICQLSPLFRAPCFLMPSCYCGVLVTDAAHSNNTTDKRMVAGEGHLKQTQLCAFTCTTLSM